MSTDGTTERSGAPRGALFVVFESRVVFRLSKKGKSGDPAGMLDAVLTNSVPKDGSAGAYALLLDAKGRVQTDLRVVKSGEDLLVVAEEAGAGAAREILGRYAPFSQTELEETDLTCFGVYGEEAKHLLGRDLPEHESAWISLGQTQVLAVGVSLPMEGFEVIFPSTASKEVEKRLVSLGASAASAPEYEAVRIFSGTPRFGADITPENLPAEANLEGRAVNFQKGCYPGQETVARMRYRGSPNKRLYRFEVEGGKPSAGSPILQNGKEAGFLTSVSPLPVNGKTYALGYLRRRADTEGPLTAGDAHLKVSGAGKE